VAFGFWSYCRNQMAKPPQDPLDRPLPADPAMEASLLGGIILGGRSAFELVSAFLGVGDLALEQNRLIWYRLQALYEEGSAIDRLTLASAMHSRGELDKVGGLSRLIDLDSHLPDNPNLTAYAKVVKAKSARRRLMFLGNSILSHAADDSIPIEETITSSAGVLDDLRSGPAEDSGKTPQQIVEGFKGGIGAFLDPTLRDKGLPTPWHRFNDLIGGGFREGELIVLAARPGMGKSAMALNMAGHVALHPKIRQPVAYFSLEMTAASLLTRLMCAEARVDSHKFRAGFLNHDERRRLQVTLDELLDAPLWIIDHFGITMPELKRHIKRGVREHGWRLVVVDYLQLIGADSKSMSSDNRTTELGRMTRQLKVSTEEDGIPVVLLSQLSRANEKRPGNKKPILSDLRESGSIEQDADVVAFIHREELYNRDRADIKGLAELIVAKQRSGPLSTVDLRYIGAFTRFENKAEDVGQEDLSEYAPPAPAQESGEGW